MYKLITVQTPHLNLWADESEKVDKTEGGFFLIKKESFYEKSRGKKREKDGFIKGLSFTCQFHPRQIEKRIRAM